MRKTQQFCDLISLGFILHHYNAERNIIYWHKVTECVHLSEERI